MQVGAYALKGTADVLLRQLEAADRRDTTAEVTAKRYGCFLALFLVLAVVSLRFPPAFRPPSS
jgi:hypothetical protein